VSGPLENAGGVTGTLTDGTGVSALVGSKIVKDLILDALLSVPVSLLAVNVTGLEQALVAPLVVALAVGDSLIRVGYRALLRWAQS
jgi:ABC-type antimicrobial peptide transport system permease subunit